MSKLIKGIGKGVRKIGDYVHSFTPGAYAHKRSMEAWREQTEYNSPKNQMARFKEAGMNPNLVFGQGTVAQAGNASPAPEQNPSEGSGLLSILGKFVEGVKAVSETRRTKALTEGQNIENIWNRWYTTGKGELGKWTKEEGYTGSARAVQAIADVNLTEWKKYLTDKQIDQVEANIAKINQDTRWKDFENDFRDQYKMNTNEGWKVKLAVAILQALGGKITDKSILNIIR
jgi:hypothetical protein